MRQKEGEKTEDFFKTDQRLKSLPYNLQKPSSQLDLE